MIHPTRTFLDQQDAFLVDMAVLSTQTLRTYRQTTKKACQQLFRQKLMVKTTLQCSMQVHLQHFEQPIQEVQPLTRRWNQLLMHRLEQR
jgi:hypothetical protein